MLLKIIKIPMRYCKLTGKPCYSKKDAQSAKNRRWDEDHIELRIYPCNNHWHLTHKL